MLDTQFSVREVESWKRLRPTFQIRGVKGVGGGGEEVREQAGNSKLDRWSASSCNSWSADESSNRRGANGRKRPPPTAFA